MTLKINLYLFIEIKLFFKTFFKNLFFFMKYREMKNLDQNENIKAVFAHSNKEN